MSLDEFWNGHPQNYFIYLDVYVEKIKEQQKYDDYVYWLSGRYTLDAFSQTMHNAFSKSSKNIFPKKPYLEEDKKTVKQQAIEWLNQVKKSFRKGE